MFLTFCRNSLLHNCKNIYNSSRTFTSSPISLGLFGPPEVEGLAKRIGRKLGLYGSTRPRLMYAGHRLYIKVCDEMDHKPFFELCDMEDTFLSWFRVLELNVWMLSARLMEEGEDGIVIRNAMIKAMWEDNEEKSSKLDGALASARRDQISELNKNFRATLISYDEGLLGSDKVLAGALWRRFLRSKEPANQEELLKQIVALEMLVLFVRYQFKQYNSYSREKLILRQNFQLTPFNKDLFTRGEHAKMI